MLQVKSAQKRQTAIPLKRRNPVDGTLVIILIMLLLAGLLVLFSATFYTGTSTRSPYSEVLKQLLGIGLGTAACIVTSRIPYRCWQHPYVVVGGLALSAVLLVLVIIPGVGVYINGSRRWLSLGGLSFQPSEIAKFAVVLYMATTLTYRGERIRRLFTGIVPVLVVPGVVFLLILEQPNLSTAGSILIVSLILIIMAGAKWRHILLMLIGGLGVGAFYAWSEPYRRRRLLSFRNPFSMMSDEGYQLSQSLIAFGSGGIFGMGLGMGRQKYAYLPYPESDFIFAIVGEDFGLLGCLIVVALFVALMLRPCVARISSERCWRRGLPAASACRRSSTWAWLWAFCLRQGCPCRSSPPAARRFPSRWQPSASCSIFPVNQLFELRNWHSACFPA